MSETTINTVRSPNFSWLTASRIVTKLNCGRPAWGTIGALTCLVLFVSINDVYWSFKTQDTLLENERNPIGRWLIRVDHGDIALFMTAKMVGTMLVVAAIPLVYWLNSRVGLTVAVFIASFQFMLCLQLNFHIPVLAWI